MRTMALWKNKTFLGKQIGLVAQEVQEVFPDLVQEDEKGQLSVRYTRFVPLLIEAVREQNVIINEQGAMINKLLESNNKQEVLIEELEKKNALIEQKVDAVFTSLKLK